MAGAVRITRRKTRTVKVGNVRVGGGAPVSVQSMTKTRTADAAVTIRQIRRLEKAGCEIIRLAVAGKEDADSFVRIRKAVRMPLEADIHFHYKLALKAIDAGADCVRLNPGNISRKKDVEEVISRAKVAKVPIRIGLNSGSLPAGRGSVEERMVRVCRDYLRIFENKDFYDIIISLKTADPVSCVAANRMMAKMCDYPFHLGVTAAGPGKDALIKSAIGIGTLLLDGIGDTIRLSLTAPPEAEVAAGRMILQNLGIRRFYHEIISCPTCGRCEIDLRKIVREVEKHLHSTELRTPNSELKTLRIAVMGCVVNGPGEAKEADIGIAGGKHCGLLFKKGKILRKVKEGKLVGELLWEIKTLF